MRTYLRREFIRSGWLVFAVLLCCFTARQAVTALDATENPVCRWRPAAPAPLLRFEAASAVVDRKLYLIGGWYTGLSQATNRVDAYDPVTDTWTQRADLPTLVTHAAMAADTHTIWIIGGFVGDSPGVAVDTVWKYDTLTDTWSEGPPLPEPLASGTAALIGRDLHYTGGLRADRDTDSTNHWVLNLDEGRRWRSAAPFLNPRNHLASVVLDGRWYVVGGQFHHDKGPVDVALVDVYDPAADTWTPLASLPGPRSHAESSIFVLNGEIVIAGGRDISTAAFSIGDVLAYNPQTDRWRTLGYLPQPLIGLVVQPVGDVIVMTTGTHQYQMEPEARTWIAVPGSEDCLTAPPPAALEGLRLVASTPAVVNTPVYLEAALSSGSGMIFAWDFGDGTQLVGEAALTHTYSMPGSYIVSVTAVNRAGEQTATTTIEVAESPAAP